MDVPMGGWMDEWMRVKPDLRDCLAQTKNDTIAMDIP
jgi:hypothetical protein